VGLERSRNVVGSSLVGIRELLLDSRIWSFGGGVHRPVVLLVGSFHLSFLLLIFEI
jgi:hypothetical protein